MNSSSFRAALPLAAAMLVLQWPAAGQTGEESIRQLWNTQFFQQRPAGKKPASARRPVTYRAVGPAAPKPATVAAGVTDTLLGVTLWRLRKPSTADDPATRLLVLEEASGDQTELVPERIEVETQLGEGDRVRLTIEVPRTGHLYVIDRELYTDGSTSPPYLIFPNYTTRPGDNVVAAGRVIEIPDQRDRPNHFRLRRSRPDQASELLSMLITPEPLPELKIGRRPLRLAEEQYQEWEKKYAVEAERFELAGGAGQTWTKEEKAAGSSGDSRLTQDDPMPQTLYRVAAEPGKTILVKLPVRLKK